MAKEEKKTDDKKKETAKDEKSPAAGGKNGILSWAVMAVIVIGLAGGGFVLGRLLANPQVKEKSADTAESKKEEKKTDTVNSPNDTWYFNELESVVVNPDEPGATRYVRVGLTLEISSELTQEKTSSLVTSKKPLLINWLNLYFKSLSLAEMQNDRDMKRILSQICDAFNEILFPGSKPHIKKILIREFNIQ